MAKLKPIEEFADDVKDGDLVKFPMDDGNEFVGYSFRSRRGYYKIRQDLRGEIDGCSRISPNQFYFKPDEPKQRGILGYKIVERASKR